MSDHDRFTRYVDRLTDAETLTLHRIVCRRAASIYGPMFKARQEAGYRAAMSKNDTRFQKGLTVLENITRAQAARASVSGSV